LLSLELRASAACPGTVSWVLYRPMGEQTGIVERRQISSRTARARTSGILDPRRFGVVFQWQVPRSPVALAATGDEPAIAVCLRQAMEKTDAENAGFIPTACPSIVAALERGQEGFLAALARVVVGGER